MRRVLAAFFLLFCACTHQPGLTVAAAPDGGAWSASGNVVLLGARFPATWHFDEAQRRSLFEISVGDGRQGWVLLDWATARGYSGGDGGCFEFALHTPMPDAAQLRAGRTAPSGDQMLPDGLTLVHGGGAMADIVVVQEPEAVVLFEVSGFAAAAAVSLERDVTSCRPMAELREALLSSHPARPQQAEDAKIARNLAYTFRGKFYDWMKYQGAEEWQTESQYTTAVEACKNAGTDKCKPYWTTGGWLGRYGYHCGDGWGSGNVVVSPQDYCCKLHDAEVWGGTGNQAANLCGFAACITCKYYRTMEEWREKFAGDHYATVVIVGQVSAGLGWIACYPVSPVTGFTCD